MPKEPTSKTVLIRQWINKDPNFTTDGKIIFCQPCSKQINADRKCHFDQHKATNLHQRNAGKIIKEQPLINQALETPDQHKFTKDLCNAMVATKMPWTKLENPVFREFLSKYTKMRIPSESTLRKNYLAPCYENIMQQIKEDIGSSYYWISVDESTDRCGRYVANVIIGKLGLEPSRSYLIACTELEKTNYSTIARTVRDALRRIWPTEQNDDRLFLLVTDAAAYMIKAGESLKVFYQNMIHLTCMAHGIHRIAEHVRGKFPRVDKIISSGKKVFLKAPSRVVTFKELLPNIPLPPQPIITRWGTWLDAALYYAEHAVEIKEVIDAFDVNEAASIREAKVALQDPALVGDLAFIKCHFGNLGKAITTLETRNMPLVDSIRIVKDVEHELRNIPGAIGREAVTKLDAVLKRNPGWKDILEIAGVLDGSGVLSSVRMNPNQLASMKFCPITSCDVERSFSHYKNILADNRASFEMENLEKYIISSCYMIKD